MDILTLQTLSIEDPEATVYQDGDLVSLREWLHVRCAKFNYDRWVEEGYPDYATNYLAGVEARPNYLRYRLCSICSRPLRVDNPR